VSRAVSFSVLAPKLTSLSPNSAALGGAGVTLTLTGANFLAGSIVKWGGATLATSYVSATQLTATIPSTDLTATGAVGVTVANDSTAASTAVNFTVNPPHVASLSPNSTTAGGAAFTLTVNGTNFLTGSTVAWGSTALTTSYVSATQLTATVPVTLIAQAGTPNVTVSNGTGAASTAVVFTINAPKIASLSPSFATAGGSAFTLTVNGSNFLAGSAIQFGQTALTTTYVSATKLTASVPGTLVASLGSASVTVANAAGTNSAAVTFTIKAQ